MKRRLRIPRDGQCRGGRGPSGEVAVGARAVLGAFPPRPRLPERGPGAARGADGVEFDDQSALAERFRARAPARCSPRRVRPRAVSSPPVDARALAVGGRILPARTQRGARIPLDVAGSLAYVACFGLAARRNVRLRV